MRAFTILLLGLPLSGLAIAQSSPSYHLKEQSFNEGGHPSEGTVVAAPHFQIKIDAIDSGPVATGVSGPSYRVDSGFVAGYPPPGELGALAFASKTALQWHPDASASAYEVYRNTIGSLPGDYGSCFASGQTTTSSADVDIPGSGSGYFYLVTARNRLGEEGTKGFRTGGTERTNVSPCP